MRFLAWAVIACCCQMGVSAFAQESDESSTSAAQVESICADAGVDLSKAEMTRAERRALRRCQRQAANAARNSAADATADADTAADDEGLICRRQIVTGSHRRVRVCTTRAQRAAARESSQELIRDGMRRSGGAASQTQ